MFESQASTSGNVAALGCSLETGAAVRASSSASSEEPVASRQSGHFEVVTAQRVESGTGDGADFMSMATEATAVTVAGVGPGPVPSPENTAVQKAQPNEQDGQQDRPWSERVVAPRERQRHRSPDPPRFPRSPAKAHLPARHPTETLNHNPGCSLWNTLITCTHSSHKSTTHCTWLQQHQTPAQGQNTPSDAQILHHVAVRVSATYPTPSTHYPTSPRDRRCCVPRINKIWRMVLQSRNT
mmetsp:Transcript_29664/g.60926  ORF Transcript_29664/g.60926 Transcript_29664/m.60926 type:complete len:240 (+) Transcript_29664:266-985(+)